VGSSQQFPVSWLFFHREFAGSFSPSCRYSVGPDRCPGRDHPHLSWILKPTNPSSRGLRQRAYQILVASSEELLSQDQGDLWDSGKMMSDQTIHVEYAGEPLSSGQKVYWKVRVWDGNGNASAWSTPGFWIIGCVALRARFAR
jgi:alpha-L-rhamnosidase